MHYKSSTHFDVFSIKSFSFLLFERNCNTHSTYYIFIIILSSFFLSLCLHVDKITFFRWHKLLFIYKIFLYTSHLYTSLYKKILDSIVFIQIYSFATESMRLIINCISKCIRTMLSKIFAYKNYALSPQNIIVYKNYATLCRIISCIKIKMYKNYAL